MTNLDWLRSLSAEDIGKLFGRNTICEYIEEHDATWCHCRMHCDPCECVSDWLKEEKNGTI